MALSIVRGQHSAGGADVSRLGASRQAKSFITKHWGLPLAGSARAAYRRRAAQRMGREHARDASTPGMRERPGCENAQAATTPGMHTDRAAHGRAGARSARTAQRMPEAQGSETHGMRGHTWLRDKACNCRESLAMASATRASPHPWGVLADSAGGM